MNRSFLRPSPGGLLKLALRLPVYLYRVHLGWLVGHRFLLLTHVGRKSGQVRRTVLEVLSYNPRTKESIVLSAWGEKSDWYLNIKVRPALEVQTGFLHYAPRQHVLSPQEGRALYSRWERQHPLEARLASLFLAHPGTGSRAERRAFAASLPMVAFRPGD